MTIVIVTYISHKRPVIRSTIQVDCFSTTESVGLSKFSLLKFSN